MTTRTQRTINARGETVERQVKALTQDQRDQRDQGRAQQRAQAQAQAEQAALEKQAMQYFIRGEAFPTELKDYHAALGEVLTASVGEVVALPARPAIRSAPKVR